MYLLNVSYAFKGQLKWFRREKGHLSQRIGRKCLVDILKIRECTWEARFKYNVYPKNLENEIMIWLFCLISICRQMLILVTLCWSCCLFSYFIAVDTIFSSHSHLKTTALSMKSKRGFHNPLHSHLIFSPSVTHLCWSMERIIATLRTWLNFYQLKLWAITSEEQFFCTFIITITPQYFFFLDLSSCFP